MTLDGVDIKEVCQYSTICSTFYTTVNINVHKQRHDFQCTSTVRHKMYAQRHAAVSIIQLRLTVNDVEFTAVSVGRSNQGTVEIREVHVGRMTWSRGLPPSLRPPAVLCHRQWWGTCGVCCGSLTCNRQTAVMRFASTQYDAVSWTLNDWQRRCNG